MFSYDFKVYAFICATLLATTATRTALAQDDQDEQDFNRKPWPTYSFQNMPKTRFTCSDKILGGYYADPETQCQMFHVCVKLPGVGVRDYRFLCPNGTLFDQDTQICANWNDVYCDQSGQFLGGGDSNDLYRDRGAGVGADSKRADEEEGTFHLQRAESGDIRRSKESQKTRPNTAASAAAEQTQNYGKQQQRFEATTRNNYNTQTSSSKRPIVSFYTPTTTTSSTTERYNDDSKQDFDEIFKGSHSSHFFSNRNGGREDDFVDHPVKSKPNDFTDFSKKPTEKSRATINRGAARTTTTTTSTTTTAAPVSKIPKKITLHASYNTDFLDYAQFYKSTTASTTTTTSTTTARPTYNSASRFGFSFSDYQTQEKIQPTTYNPNNSVYRQKTTSANNLQDNDYEKNLNKPTATSSRKTQKNKLGPQDSNFINQNEFTEFAKVKPLPSQPQPQPFQPAQSAQRPTKLNATKPIEPHYYRSRGSQPVRLGSQEPAPFSVASASAAAPRTRLAAEGQGRTRVAAPAASNAVSSSARAITNRGSITYKATTQRDSYGSDLYYTATTTNTKKPTTTFAPPKDLYTPTTFKPTTYKKAYEQSFYQTPRTIINAKPQKIYSTSTTTKTTALPVTVNPYQSGDANPDEDDGQYHPELYESDFPRNRIKHLRARTTTSTTTKPSTPTAQAVNGGRQSNYNHNFQHAAQSHLKTQQQSAFQKEKEQAQSGDSSDEDELFNTAQSLNFGAASINKLRADIYKAEKTSQQYNSQYSPNVPLSSPKTVAPATSTTNGFTYSAYSAAFSTAKPFSTTYLTTPTTTTTTTSTTTTTTTTRRPTTTTPRTTTTTPAAIKLNYDEEPKRSKSGSSKSNKKDTKSKSKRPPHADEDTSYDYAYYDTDTLIDDYP